MKTFLVGFIAVALLSGCEGVITHSATEIRVTIPKPLVTPRAATVGVYYPPTTRDYRYREPFSLHPIATVEVHLGSASVPMFDAVIGALFERVVPLSELPTNEQPRPDLDGVFKIRVSSFTEHASTITITYETSLYDPQGRPLGQWEVSGSVGPVRLGGRPLRTATEEAMREAAAEFVVTFHDQNIVKEWIADPERPRAQVGS